MKEKFNIYKIDSKTKVKTFLFSVDKNHEANKNLTTLVNRSIASGENSHFGVEKVYVQA